MGQRDTMPPPDEETTEESSDRPKDRPSFLRRPLLKALSAGAALSVGSGAATASDDEPEFKTEVIAGPATFPDDVRVALNADYEDGSVDTRFVRDASDTLIIKGTLDPGATSGWHVDRGPVLVNVVEGKVELTIEDKPECFTHTYKAGEAIAVTGNHADLVENPSSSKEAVAYATFFDIPEGEPPVKPIEPPDC